jgi:hypothetical protein
MDEMSQEGAGGVNTLEEAEAGESNGLLLVHTCLSCFLTPTLIRTPEI